MNKIKILIVALVLCCSIFLLSPSKVNASSKQDYVLTSPPLSLEQYGEMIDIKYINYHITYYSDDNLYFLREIEILINDSSKNIEFSVLCNTYLPSDIKYIGIYFSPVYEYEDVDGIVDYCMDLELYCRLGDDVGDVYLNDLGVISGINHYAFDGFGGLFTITYTNINSSYNLGYNDGSKDTYTNAYNKGYQEGLKTADNDFNALFWGIADVPSQVLFSVLSFEIFGVNAFSILFSILTVLLIAWLIKKFVA